LDVALHHQITSHRRSVPSIGSVLKFVGRRLDNPISEVHEHVVVGRAMPIFCVR